MREREKPGDVRDEQRPFERQFERSLRSQGRRKLPELAGIESGRVESRLNIDNGYNCFCLC